ncbi:MAG TPA: tail fiber protein [Verrucomicrobiae bacterium]|nr:tail fiber protein [Verrucomicrobiae bacterium]
MSEPFVGEIRIAGFNFAPVNWAFCNGALMAISQNEALFQLIGTTYGGDGVNTFALPNLQGRVPVHMGTTGQGSFVMGQIAGTETVTVTTSQIPSHTHTPVASAGDGTSDVPTNNTWANWTGAQYNTGAPVSAPMRSDAIGLTGGSQPHDNMIPFLTINFIIALFGIFPTQS